jgi:hypothetical protein
MAPGVVPAIVGKIIVSLVHKQDVSVGTPWTMGTALRVIATPTKAALTTAMLTTTAPPPSPGGEVIEETATTAHFSYQP